MKTISLGPIIDPDGLPSDMTMEMFGHGGVCRRAYLTGDCPYSHDWVKVSAYPRDLPTISYGHDDVDDLVDDTLADLGLA